MTSEVTYKVFGILSLMIVISCGDGNDSSPTTPRPTQSAGTETPASPVAKIAPLPASQRIANIGLSTPESVLYDPQTDLYLVSNIQGSPVEMDDNGFITRLNPDGTVKDLKWIDGTKDDVTLSAPKGMALSADTLYVSDIDHVRLFDRATGAPKGSIKVINASFLNDMAIGPDGTIYVSDSGVRGTPKGLEPTGTDAVYRIQGKRAVKVIKNKALGNPNGIAADDEGLWLVTFGSGALLRLDKKGTELVKVKFPKGGLDGVVKLDSVLLISSWQAQAVYSVPLADLHAENPEPQFKAVVRDIKTPADIGFDMKRNRILIPLFEDNAIIFHAYK
jgi:glucose/arabinose dehydrogenase